MLRVVFIWETIPRRDRQPTRPPRVIAEPADGDRAMACIERIEACCRGFANFPERGMRRDDLFPGLRVVGFERWVTIAFHVGADTVTFLRILYGGRDIDTLMH